MIDLIWFDINIFYCTNLQLWLGRSSVIRSPSPERFIVSISVRLCSRVLHTGESTRNLYAPPPHCCNCQHLHILPQHCCYVHKDWKGVIGYYIPESAPDKIRPWNKTIDLSNLSTNKYFFFCYAGWLAHSIVIFFISVFNRLSFSWKF